MAVSNGLPPLLEAMAVPVVEFGPGGVMLAANAALRRLADCPSPEPPGVLPRWVHREDRAALRLLVDQCIRERRPAEARFRVCLDGDGLASAVAILSPHEAADAITCVAILHVAEDSATLARAAAAPSREEVIARAVADAGIGVWEADLDHGVAFWSPEMETILGPSSEPERVLTPREFFKRVHPDDLERVQAEMGAALLERRTFRLRFRILRHDGSIVHVLQTGRLADPTGADGRLIGTLQDVTEQARRVEELERLRADLEDTQQTAGIATWRTDLRTGERTWSAEMYRITGQDPATYVPSQNNREQIYHPDDTAVIEEMRAATLAGEPFRVRYRVVRPDGGVRWVESHGNPQRDEHGAVIAYVGTARDVTDAVEHQAQLDRLNHHLQVAQSVAGLGSWERDLRTFEGYWSDEMYRLFGLEPGSVEPSLELLRSMTHPDDRHIVQGTKERGASPDDEANNLIRIIRADGEQRWLRVRSVREYEDGLPVRLVGIDQDVTEFIETEQALRESERLLREAHAAARQGHWDWDIVTGTIQWSEQIFTMFGEEPRAFEPTYDAFMDRIHPDDRAQVQDAVDAALAGGPSEAGGAEYRVRHRVIRRDGTVRTVEERGQVVFAEDGRPVRMLGIVRDITEQAEQEAELERVRTHLEHAQRIANVGSYEWDPKAGDMWLSDHAHRIYGLEPGDPRATMDNFLRALAAEDRRRFLDAVNPRLEAMDRLEGPDRLAMTVHTSTVDGRELVLLHIGEASRQPDGRVIVRGALMDVTEQVRLREQAEESARETASIISASLLPIIVIGERGAIQMANAATERVFGWNPDELVGRDVAVLAAGLTEEQHGRYLAHYLATGEASTAEGLVVGRTREVRGRRKDGTEFPAQLTVAESQSPRGRRFIGIVMDLTDAKAAEERLLRMQKAEALGTLVAGVAHDFNNLLTAIQGGIEMAAEDLGASRWLNIADQAAMRAADLVQQLLRFSRREEPHRTAVSPEALMRETSSLVRELLDRRIYLEVDIEPGVPTLQGDPGQLQQVLMNLLVNARDAVLARAGQADEAGAEYYPAISLRVTSERQGSTDGVRFTCEDNGTGMTAEVLERAFDPFFTTKTVDQGTGLGLATVSGIVERHEGRVSVESEPGRGTTVHVWLPLDAPAEEEEADAPAERSPTSSPQGEAPPLVLVVDDEEAIGQVAAGFLESGGYEVILATRGDQAIALVRDDPSAFALAIVDLNMPAPDGWAVLAALREVAPGMPVLIASGYADQDEVHARGGAALLPKPYTRAQLLGAADALHEGPARD